MLDRRGGLGLDVHEYIRTKIEALRQALAQPETEPVYAFRRKGLDEFCTCDKRRYDELAGKPDLFEVTVFYTAPVDAVNMSQERVDETAKSGHEFECPRCGHCCKEWVGLTDEERKAFSYFVNWEMLDQIEAKLKEKNT